MSTSVPETRTGSAPAPQQPPDQPETRAVITTGEVQASITKWKGGRTTAGLTPAQIVLAGFFLFGWLNLFAGGLLVDTSPYRCAISFRGVEAINPDKPLSAHPCYAYWSWDEKRQKKIFNRPVFTDSEGLPLGQPVMTWALAILFYTPLNLAFISAAAGALGSLASIANLNPDTDGDADGAAETKGPRDRTNPLLSGLLRGGFVYLFMISGMLLFDDSPFSMTSPDQYLRLAGFLSLFSFVVNYQPNVFGTLIDWAHTRIHARQPGGKAAGQFGGTPPGTEATTVNTTVSKTATVVKSPAAPVAEAGQPAAGEPDQPSRNGHSKGGRPGGPAE